MARASDMRIRQIKPSWWLDKDLRTRLSADAREFYVGLWMLADDDGWLDWDLTRIAAELYPYGVNGGGLFDGDPFEARERLVTGWAQALGALDQRHPHLIVYECGHARVPKIVEHQRFGGRPVYTVGRIHARDCARVRADAPRGIPTGKGTERKGTVGGDARIPDGSRDPTFADKMVAAGLDPKVRKH
jgi:hypothetical protein